MKFDVLKNALLTVTDRVFHYECQKKSDRYIVWAEDGQGDTVWADGNMQQQVIQGTINYFTKTEYDEAPDRIQQALGAVNISYRLNSIQFEEEAGYIHFEWVWEL